MLQRLGDECHVRVELRGASWAPALALNACLTQHPIDGGVMDAELLGDGAHAPVLDEVQAQNLCLDLLVDRHRAPLSVPCAGAGAPAHRQTPPPQTDELTDRACNVVAYLGRYTHKSAIANHRLVDFDGEHVRFRWRDYAHGNKLKAMTLDASEFIRRFRLHVLPRRFTRLRHYGVLANRSRTRNLALCRGLLGQPEPEPREPETPQAMMLRLTGTDITVCRTCERECQSNRDADGRQRTR